MSKFVFLAAFLFIALNLLAGALEGRVEARLNEEVGPLIAGPQFVEQSGSGGNFITNRVNSLVGGFVTTVGYPVKSFKLMLKWLSWDYDFFGGSYFYVKLLILWPISLTMVLTVLIPTFGRVF